MKCLEQYINQHKLNESLSNDVKVFFDNVYKTQQKLASENKVTPVNVDDTKLTKPKSSFEKEDLFDDSIKQIITNKSVGFVVAAQMISNANKYFTDDDKELNPTCYPYFYTENNNNYCVGLLMYDEKTTYIDNFVTLVLIEPALCAAKALVVNKGILNDFCDMMKDKYQGIVVKPVHPKLKAVFTQLGFKSIPDNKELMTLKLK